MVMISYDVIIMEIMRSLIKSENELYDHYKSILTFGNRYSIVIGASIRAIQRTLWIKIEIKIKEQSQVDSRRNQLSWLQPGNLKLGGSLVL